MNIKKALYFALVCALVLPLSAWAHEFHTSITDAHYNPKTQTYELAVRVFANDLEEALSRRHKTNIRLDRSERVNKLLAEYLQAHLSISGAKGTKVPQKFLGAQEEADAVWLYLEIPAGKVPSGQLFVQNALLTEVFSDQTNILNLEIAGKKRSVLCRTGDVQKTLAL
ncbi:hypothetical protein TH63_12400 [Rufibacter radiotolerans]|uniref:Uncharacterized protein n=1 Tax=Rufibacter radiotolerans TaxID=1379910 RepID=A0A0H4VLM1_9BACT|nr:DUF6702 family protein [Rufibacter radiotolerans]AKQ46238.1 hypothetical protein TH63_12400 [Rufibacter radiotolerans]